jgi:hypothetical protein
MNTASPPLGHDARDRIERDPIRAKWRNGYGSGRQTDEHPGVHRHAGRMRTLAKELGRENVEAVSADLVDGPFQDVGKVDLRNSAETNAPCPLGHDGSVQWFGR